MGKTTHYITNKRDILKRIDRKLGNRSKDFGGLSLKPLQFDDYNGVDCQEICMMDRNKNDMLEDLLKDTEDVAKITIPYDTVDNKYFSDNKEDLIRAYTGFIYCLNSEISKLNKNNNLTDKDFKDCSARAINKMLEEHDILICK